MRSFFSLAALHFLGAYTETRQRLGFFQTENPGELRAVQSVLRTACGTEAGICDKETLEGRKVG